MKWSLIIKEYETFLIKEKSLARNSVLAYIADIKKLNEFLSEKYEGISYKKVSLKHLEEYMESPSNQDISIRTQARIVSSNKSFFKYLFQKKVISLNPSALLKAPKVPRKIPVVLTTDEIDMMLDSFDRFRPLEQRNKAILELLYSCGLSVNELENAKIGDIDFEESLLKVLGKGETFRLVPIIPQALAEIKKYLTENREVGNRNLNDILFLNTRDNKFDRLIISYIIKKTALKVGIKKKVNPQIIRQSFAVHLIKGGTDLRTVQMLMGHESIHTTEVLKRAFDPAHKKRHNSE